MSKTLIRLIDEAIIPSLLLALAKIGGLYLSAVIFQLQFDIVKSEKTTLAPFAITFQTTKDLMLANSLSNTAMLLIAAFGSLYVLYKISGFQDRRITPQKLIQLADRGLLSLIEPSYNVYLKAFVWIIFLWISVILATVCVFAQEASLWSAVLALIIGVICTLLLVKNVEIDYTKSGTQT